ncbi:hypothetical protein [Motiliproteus sp.]|uniref:hypothetical protein n=1 Tax=Motiliproteus sp. TaxID=1898955 RepID=UPI003BABBCB4
MKRFNYTGRKKILREDVKIRLTGDFNDKPAVNVAIDLSGYEFSLSDTVFLEPQSKTRFMRIRLGEASNSVRRNSIELEEFDDAEGLDFRVKVVDESKGTLLGIAENIKPYNKDDELDGNQQSILPVSSVDLAPYGVLWRVGWGDQKVVLEIERELGSRDQVVRSVMFKAFIWPVAMRQILTKILSDDGWDHELSDPEELSTRWLLFTKQIGAGTPDPDSDDNEEWLDNAVRMLTKIIGIRQQAIDDFAAGAWK